MDNFINEITGWAIGLRRSPEEMRFCNPEEMTEHKIESKSNGEITIVWRGHPEFGNDFRVIQQWTKDSKGYYSGRFSYSGYKGKELVEEIHFPIVTMNMESASEFVSGCWDIGVIWRGQQLDSAKAKHGIRRNYTSMQFSALLNKQQYGVYFDHRDSEWNAKGFEFKIAEDNKSAQYHGIHYVAGKRRPLEAYAIPYSNGCMKFNGGWFEAGQIYKAWGTAQSWNQVDKRPNRLRDIGVWVWNRGKVEDVIPPVKQLQQDCGSIPVALDWYWWHHCPYDTDYPDYWPPREGENVFRNAIADLKQCGIFSQVYINGACWDMDSPSRDEGGTAGIRFNNNGTPEAYECNRYTHHRLGTMCGEAPEFHTRIINVVGKLHATGLDGQYLDMIGGIGPDVCFNPSHNHSFGGGNHGVTGYRKLLQELQQKYPDMSLSTEYCNEAFMDLLDGAIVCNSVSAERLGLDYEIVPLFPSVYSGRLALFGSYASLDSIPPWDALWPDTDRWPVASEKKWHQIFPEQFYLELSRAVIWGVQPMVCNLKTHYTDDPEFSEMYDFILKTVRFYYERLDYFFDGEMLSPVGFECAEKEVYFMSRMIFTKEADMRTISKQQPAILHTRRRNRRGLQALFAVNYTNDEQKWQYYDHSGVLPPHSWLHLALD